MTHFLAKRHATQERVKLQPSYAKREYREESAHQASSNSTDSSHRSLPEVHKAVHPVSVQTVSTPRPSDEILRLKRESPSLETLCECSQCARDLYSISRRLQTADPFLTSISEIAALHSLHYEFSRATLLTFLANEVPVPRDVSSYAQSDLICSICKAAQTEASQRMSALLFDHLRVYMQM
jgi:hypothetical protein